jgi:hypothetical protein
MTFVRASIFATALLTLAAAKAATAPAMRTFHDEASGLSMTYPAAWELSDKPVAGRPLLLAKATPYSGDPKHRPVIGCMELDLPGAAPSDAKGRIEGMLDKTWRTAPPEEHIEIAPVAREDLSGLETWRTRVYYPAQKQTSLILLMIRNGKGIYCNAAWAETNGAEMQAAWKTIAIERRGKN